MYTTYETTPSNSTLKENNFFERNRVLKKFEAMCTHVIVILYYNFAHFGGTRVSLNIQHANAMGWLGIA